MLFRSVGAKGEGLVFPSPVEVGQLAEAGAPVAEVVVILIAPAGGGVQGAEGAGRGAAAPVVEHQQGVVGGRRWVVISRLQPLGREGWVGGWTRERPSEQGG